ncbi:MAG TPA: YqhA family protein [Bacteroidia bacterium]|nr:YqhA family protein [Bacteroidia bacterium]HRS59386.1 YqhA family protein [Bacteroidia bacterium]HRU68721.1 YqhA family protein [Bacteroidia bacterium]
MKKIFESGSKLVILASLSLFVGFIVSSLYGFYILGKTVFITFNSYEHLDSGLLAINIIKVIDIQLLAVIQYVMSVGLYELFIGDLNLPPWLNIRTIDQLKSKLASVIILILAVKFTEKVMDWKHHMDILYLAIGVSLVIFVLTYYYKVKEERHEE